LFIRNPADIPEHLGADEKHTWILGDKVYVATTVEEGGHPFYIYISNLNI
jgi:hypothetical protein